MWTADVRKEGSEVEQMDTGPEEVRDVDGGRWRREVSGVKDALIVVKYFDSTGATACSSFLCKPFADSNSVSIVI